MIPEYEQVKPIFEANTFTPVGFGKPVNDQLAQHPHGKLWQHRLAMSVWEIVRDSFEDDHCRAFMLASPWTLQPPLDPFTGRLAYITFHQQRQSRPLAKGGSGGLTQELMRCVEAHHGVVLTNKWVTELIVENGKCAGVECADGTSYHADKAVVSTIHIKHLVDMAPRELWGQDFVDGVDTWQAETAMFVTHYATTEAPTFKVAGGIISPCEAGMLASSDRALGFGYDDASGVVNLKDPPLQIICCSAADPSRAPVGMHTLKVTGWQPYQLKEGPQHWANIKKEVSDANLK